MGAEVKGAGETVWVGRPPYLIGSLFGLSLARLWTIENGISRPGHGSGTGRKQDQIVAAAPARQRRSFFFISCVKRAREGIFGWGRGTPNKTAAMFLEYFDDGSLPAPAPETPLDRYMSTITDMATARVLLLGVAKDIAMAIYPIKSRKPIKKPAKNLQMSLVNTYFYCRH